MAKRPVVVFGGVSLAPSPRLRARLRAIPQPYVIAADSGAASALAFGYVPDLVVGDMDSIDAATLAEVERRGIPLQPYPREKDATDGQLALERALQLDPSELVLVGFLGGARLDHSLANVLLLNLLPAGAAIVEEENECRLLRPGDSWTWRARPDELVSLLPLAAEARGVSTHGLRWPLAAATLRLGDTRGISNEPVAVEVGVALGSGLLLVTRHLPGSRR